jgi:hypothetical protein
MTSKVSSHLIIHQNNSPLSKQILSITCDNASANNTMIAHLAEKLNAFPGKPNRTPCFAHILNLVAKCVMKQFDALKKKKKDNDREEGEAPEKEDVEGLGVESDGDGNDSEEELDHEDNDGEEVPDGHEGMSAAEVRVLDKSVKPVRQVLTKVSHHPIIDDNLVTLLKLRKAVYAIKNSSTLILPEWFAVLECMAQEAVEQGNKPLSSQMIPQNVAICWNTTYDLPTHIIKLTMSLQIIRG